MSFLKICSLILVFNGYYATAQTKKYICNFENGLCLFLSNVKNNKENWRIGKGKLNAADTGPSVDHTTGTANGTYLFVNVSAAKTNVVSLETVAIRKDYCVRFFYHMYGADIGSLTVSTQSVHQASDTKKYFYRTRTQGDRWKEAFFTASESGTMNLKGYRIVFTAKHNIAPSVLGDIALDDIELTLGKCRDTKRDVTQLCTFDNYDCGYSASKINSLRWEWKTLKHATTYFKKQPENDHTLGTSFGGYWYVGVSGSLWRLISSMQTAMLSSSVYKKPKTVQNCLHFYYYIDGEGTTGWLSGGVKEAYLQAFINFPNSTNGRKWLITKAKNITNHKQWTRAEVKADIPDDFQFEFVSGIDSQSEVLLAIDDIQLVTGNCPEAGFCDFEEDKCTLKDGPSRYNWVRKMGRSGTNSEIGPSVDNTLKTANGNYVVFSTKNKSPGSEADLESEFFPPNDKEMCLTFFYYMSGKDLGNLKVVFRGVTGGAKKGFMALDDIRIRTGEECDLLPPEADPRLEDPCSSSPCLNNGSCSVNGNSFKCYCLNPFFGDRCENDPCSTSPCLNNGSCSVNGNSFKCSCLNPFFGDRCENDPCSSSPCLNNGSCSVNGNSFKCSCLNPFFGDRCENDPCSSSPCLNNGSCSVNGNSFKCSCLNPFFGDRCENDPCSTSPCLNNGSCSVNGNSFKCSCLNPFFGDRCENDPCSSSTCLNNGSCSVNGNSFKCSCLNPFFGDRCENDPCSSSPCLNNGSCTVNGNSFKCTCLNPFFGDRCENDPCSSSPCLNNGSCTVNGNSFKCTCLNPFFGDRCENDPCTDHPCENGGLCVLTGNSFKCVCESPYFGNNCEKDPCTDNPCENGGSCMLLGNSFKCVCESPYFGNNCEKDPCTANPCENGGSCMLLGNSFKCVCKPPYFGNNCEKDPCTDNPCENGESCMLLGNSFKCVCESPYFGNNCEKDPCTDNPCENGGSCMLLGNSFKCVCKPPYFGNNCEKDPCTTNPCLNGGICTLYGTSFLCHCRIPYSGALCENIICNDDVCVNGKCETLGQYYRCRCDAGFTGLRCEDRIPTKSDKQVFWQIIQTSIMFYVLILLSLIFGLLLLKKK
ncbi:Fibropellin-1 like protein [Argiope bruennichi]|uniref:Fibropellin-1 like protein n=1 Tax=Argiope bruennichi TaxID=94029 RepID=A0A8T0ERU7_ARGBR|nr:Fibropellin-1 like protein [Argiope bruennichi]